MLSYAETAVCLRLIPTVVFRLFQGLVSTTCVELLEACFLDLASGCCCRTLRWFPASTETHVMHVSTGLPGKPDFASYALRHVLAVSDAYSV